MVATTRSFPMSLDRVNGLLTLLLGSLLGGVVAIQAVLCTGPVSWIPWLTGGLLLLFLGPAYALSPTGVEVDAAELRVRRRCWRALRVARSTIAGVEEGPAMSQANAVRLFGTGPFFGTFGLLHVIGFGRVRGYVTRRGPSVLVRRRDGLLPVLVTPDDPAALLALFASPRPDRVHARA